EKSQRAGNHLGDDVPFRAMIAVVRMNRRVHDRVELHERFNRDVESRNRAGRFGDETTARAVVLTHDGIGGDVALAEIFRKRPPDKLAIGARLELPALRAHRRFRTTWILPCAASRRRRPTRTHRATLRRADPG